MVVSPLARILSTAGTTTFKSAPLCTAPRPSLRCAAFTGAFWPNTILWGYSGRDCFGYGLLRQKLDGLNGRRDECLGILESLGADQSEIRHAFSRQQAVASNFKRKFLDAPRAVQKRYVHGLVSEIVVDRDKAEFPVRPPQSRRRSLPEPSKGVFVLLYENGAPEEIRTPDPQIRSLVLYPAELRAHFEGANLFRSLPKGKLGPCLMRAQPVPD